MTALGPAVADYLELRRGLGFGLAGMEHLLGDFVTFLDNAGLEVVTIDAALSWATRPADAQPSWHASAWATCGASPPTCTLSTPATRYRPEICCPSARGEPSPTSTATTRSAPSCVKLAAWNRRCGPQPSRRSSVCWR